MANELQMAEVQAVIALSISTWLVVSADRQGTGRAPGDGGPARGVGGGGRVNTGHPSAPRVGGTRTGRFRPMCGATGPPRSVPIPGPRSWRRLGDAAAVRQPVGLARRWTLSVPGHFHHLVPRGSGPRRRWSPGAAWPLRPPPGPAPARPRRPDRARRLLPRTSAARRRIRRSESAISASRSSGSTGQSIPSNADHLRSQRFSTPWTRLSARRCPTHRGSRPRLGSPRPSQRNR